MSRDCDELKEKQKTYWNIAPCDWGTLCESMQRWRLYRNSEWTAEWVYESMDCLMDESMSISRQTKPVVEEVYSTPISTETICRTVRCLTAVKRIITQGHLTMKPRDGKPLGRLGFAFCPRALSICWAWCGPQTRLNCQAEEAKSPEHSCLFGTSLLPHKKQTIERRMICLT